MTRSTRTHRRALVLAALVSTMSLPSLAEEAAIPSTWKVQEVRYSYVAFTTAYDCDSAATKIKSILKTLGAHPSTRVSATGCAYNRPARNFFVNITAAVPVPVAEVKAPTAADQSKDELLKRLGVKSDISKDEFTAVWKTVDLAKDRKLDLKPGDCELMEGLRDKVLPQLGIKVEQARLGCTPHQVSITTPQMTVSALVPAKSPDQKAGS